MLVFSVSLIRLIYDMIHKDVNPALQIVSSWMVLSVGLIDAIVYVSSHGPNPKSSGLILIPPSGTGRILDKAQSPAEDGRQIIIACM